MKYLIFILSLLSFLVATVLLVIAISSCAPDVHAEIRALWVPLVGTESLKHVNALETDEFRLYAGTSAGLYISRDDGATWSLTDLTHACQAIAIRQNAVYAGTEMRGVFRSDNRGNTWKTKNDGFHEVRWGGEDRGFPFIHQILFSETGTVITVMYHQGTYTSTNRGETWDSVIDEWILGNWQIGGATWSMTEFDGYLWSAVSIGSMLRSPDNGQSWEVAREIEHGRVTDWAVLNDRLYVAGQEGLARWDEEDRTWEYLTEGISTGHDPPYFTSLAVNRGCLFAGLSNNGVHMFDERSKTWIPAGLDGLTVTSLTSHRSDLYAVTTDSNSDALGIYRASISTVQPYGKAAATWGAVKQNEGDH